MKFICAGIMLLLFTVDANALQIVETVTKVISGDMFKTTYKGKSVTVKIADIDCPELQQPGGKEAKQLTSKLIFNTLIAIKTNGKEYNGVMTGRVTTNRGKDLAVLLSQKGLAWPEPKTRNKLVISQSKKAQKNKVGIWKNNRSEPPWQYRARTRKVVAKKNTKTKLTLYGDSVMDIARDPDGSAVGDGGGMTISSTPENSQPQKATSRRLQSLRSVSTNHVEPNRQQPGRKKHITADDYTIKLSARQSGGYVEFSGRISDGPMCERLSVTAFARSDQGGRTSVIDVVSFSSGVRSQTFDGKSRHSWYKKIQPKPEWVVTKVYASCGN